MGAVSAEATCPLAREHKKQLWLSAEPFACSDWRREWVAETVDASKSTIASRPARADFGIGHDPQDDCRFFTSSTSINHRSWRSASWKCSPGESLMGKEY